MPSLPALLASILPLLAASTHAHLTRADLPPSDAEITETGLQILHTGGPTSCRRPTHQGDTVAVNYRGTLLSTGAEFDSSYSRNRPIEFVLGIGRVIAGWDEGLEGMCVGESRKLTIPPHLAYGSSGMGAIPPESTLVFETRLEDIVAVAPGSEPLPEEGEEEEEVASTSSAVTTTSTSAFSSSSAMSKEGMTAQGSPTAAIPLSSVISEVKGAATALATMVGQVADEVGDAELSSEDLGEIDGVGIPVEAQKEADQAECKLLGPFALLVQGALGALALLTLVWKRWREEPKRPWKIFLFDVSKQVLGSFLTHIINLAMSMVGSVDVQNAVAHAVSSGGDAYTDAAGRKPNPCSYYLLNLGIDTTVGVPVLYVLLKVLYALFLKTPLARPPQSIKSGNYGSPAKFTWYLKQLFVYCIGLVGMKLFVLFLFMALPWLPWVGDWALRWTKGNEALEITFALFIFPLIMNAIQYWVIDSFIMDKKQEEQGYQHVAEDDDEEERRGFFADDEHEGVPSARGKSPGNSDDDASPSRRIGQGSRADHSKQA